MNLDNKVLTGQTSPALWSIFVWSVVITPLVAQVTGVDSNRGFYLKLSRFHSVIKHPEKLFGILVVC